VTAIIGTKTAGYFASGGIASTLPSAVLGIMFLFFLRRGGVV